MLSGCGDGLGFQPGGLFSRYAKEGVNWTILCMRESGPDRQARIEQIAEALKNTPGIRPEDVFMRHGEQSSRLYYGSYFRHVDKKTGRYQIPERMRQDFALIKDLTIRSGRFFADARTVPMPTPDAGNPAWRLNNNPGVYTLRVALFYPEPGFEERKQAAAAYCEELRGKGYEAYYRHGERTSEVFVGSFGEGAMVQQRKYGYYFNAPGPQVQALQQKETFHYELWNMRPIGTPYGEGQLMRPSQLVRVDEEQTEPEEFE